MKSSDPAARPRSGACGPSSFIVMDMLRRAGELQRQGRDIIQLGAGEPVFPLPDALRQAAAAALTEQHIGYTDAAGLADLRQAVADRYRGIAELSPDRVIVTPGSSGALDLALRLLLRPGEQVMLKSPGYPCNPNLVQMAGGEPLLVAVDRRDNYHLTPESICRHWGPRTRAVIVTSPCNPTGAVIDAAVLEEIIHTVNRLGGTVISDEIYHGLSYEGGCESAISYSPDVFIINSFSKYYGLTGWRIGWLVAPEQHTDELVRMAQNLFISVNSLSQRVALAALRPNVAEIFERRRDRFKRRRDFLVDALRELGFIIPNAPKGAFYIYADCGNLAEDSYRLAYDILESVYVTTTPGADFGGADAQRYIRFSYTASFSDIERAAARLAAYF